MKRTSWLCWLVALSAVWLAEAQFKYRRPLPPPMPPPQIFKKSWAPGPRIPPMGNSIHMAGNFPHKRPMFKPPNYRFRRPPGPPPPPPPPMFNVLPSSYKSPMPPSLGMMAGNYAPSAPGGLGPQRVLPPVPVKELQSIAKAPQQYSPEYRPESAPVQVTHRGGFDDDRGPIHTIPAPNLGPASKSYQQQQQQQQQGFSENKGEESSARRPYTVTQIDYASVFNGQESNVTPQRVSPSNPTPTNNIPHQYEVTESNEVNSVPPTYFTPDFESAQYASSVIQEQQANDVYLSHPSSAGSRSSSSAGEQSQGVNLQSSMHVGSSGNVSPAAAQGGQQDLHVGHPGLAGPPMSAAKLYEVLNAFPQQLTDQYALSQQPQIQQHLLQQQLSQILQQQDDQNAVKASFSQPTLHSFNYEEQSSKQKQQQQQQQQQNIFIDQNYASGRVTADYSLAPEASDIAQEVSVADASEPQENNIEFESSAGHVRPTTYFSKIGDDQSMASQFYTTLPNRDAAEKLAALAAAGNVNSQLIGQLRKQQQQQQQQQLQQQESQQPQSDEPMPANHKEEYRGEEQQLDQRQKLFYRRQKIREEQARRDEETEKYKQQSQEEEKRPLRIFVPENNAEKEKEAAAEDYEYENDEADTSKENEPSSEDSEFGSRIVSKTGK